jgi:hypothetical protein
MALIDQAAEIAESLSDRNPPIFAWPNKATLQARPTGPVRSGPFLLHALSRSEEPVGKVADPQNIAAIAANMV